VLEPPPAAAAQEQVHERRGGVGSLTVLEHDAGPLDARHQGHVTEYAHREILCADLEDPEGISRIPCSNASRSWSGLPGEE
jgi:hypothetical protein